MGVIGANLVLLLGVSWFVVSNRSASQTIRTSTVSSATGTASSVENPLDQLSSSEIALQAAQLVELPETLSVRNQADSINILLAVTHNDSNVLAKPQIVTTAQKSKKDILRYTTQQNDTVTGLAARFGVTPNSIRWSNNNLENDLLRPGISLLIPPGNGIVYKVKSGDTISGLINRYQADKNAFITVNDAESGSLQPNELVWIPNGVQPLVRNFSGFSFSAPSTGARRFGSCAYGSVNGYYCGYCTWWAAYRRAQIGDPVPSNLGDAYTWKYGMQQSKKPQVGAVIWFNKGRPGHVGFVESVLPDGSIKISEMNTVGWDTVSYKVFPPSQVANFLYLY